MAKIDQNLISSIGQKHQSCQKWEMPKSIILCSAVTVSFDLLPWKVGGTINGNVYAKFANDPSIVITRALLHTTGSALGVFDTNLTFFRCGGYNISTKWTETCKHHPYNSKSRVNDENMFQLSLVYLIIGASYYETTRLPFHCGAKYETFARLRPYMLYFNVS